MSKRRPERSRAPESAGPISSGRLGRVHDRVIDVLGAVWSGTPAEIALDRTFKHARDLGPSERSEVKRIVFGVVRGRRRIDAGLTKAASSLGRRFDQLDPVMQHRLRILASLVEGGATSEELAGVDAYAAKRIAGLFDRFRARLEDKKDPSARSIAEATCLPDFVVTRLVSSFGLGRAEEICRALNRRAPTTVRVNVERASREDVRDRLREELGESVVFTPLSPMGLIIEAEDAPIRGTVVFEEGLIELMDEGSQLVALAVGARPKEAVMDACAGAGGKTLALAASMAGTGHLVAVDPEGGKLEELRRRARRAGLTSIEAIQSDIRELSSNYERRFDRVLVDAPCTGSGTWRRAPDASWRASEADLLRLLELQGSLIDGAARVVKSGGLIVYATCSVLEEENEGVVRTALERDPRLEPVPLAETLGVELSAKLGATFEARVGPGPDESGPDGFYFASLRVR